LVAISFLPWARGEAVVIFFVFLLLSKAAAIACSRIIASFSSWEKWEKVLMAENNILFVLGLLLAAQQLE